MRVLVAFFSNTGNTKRIAEKIRLFFESKKDFVEMLEIVPLKKIAPKEYKKDAEVKLKNAPVDLSDFNVVFVGSPVWGSRATPVIISFLKSLENIHGKKFVLFVSCHAFSGNSIKKMSSILATKSALVLDSFVIKSLLALNEKKLNKTLEFCEGIYPKIKK